MQDKTLNQMDPIFETLGLLLVSYNLEEVKNEMKKLLSDMGFDKEHFYSQNFKTYDKYVQIFLKNRVESKETSDFFNEKDSNYITILLSLIVENKNWFESQDLITEEEINSQIFYICKAVLEDETDMESPKSLDEIVSFLDNSALESEAKWKLLRIMQNPIKHIKQIIDIINSNMNSYHKAVKEIAGSLEKLLNQYNMMEIKSGDKRFYEVKKAFTESAIVYPSLAFPLSQMLFENSCYYGLLCEKIVKNGKIRNNSKELLLLKLKALSDNSKLGIIASLKVSPKYNLEIAQQLGLTAATMSHHMTALLNCNLVGIEKKDGKVYYHLEKENLQELIKELEETLL